MDTTKKELTSVDEYIKSFPQDVQTILQRIRDVIKETAPDATETISYKMPTFKLNGTYLVYFAAWKTHIGFYATPAGNEAFREELSPYKGAKGSIQFPLDQPIPYDLIKKIVMFRMEDTDKKSSAKSK